MMGPLVTVSRSTSQLPRHHQVPMQMSSFVTIQDVLAGDMRRQLRIILSNGRMGVGDGKWKLA